MTSEKYKESFVMRNPILTAIIIGMSVSGLLMIGIYITIVEIDKIPIVQRTVDSHVLIDGYTECVFVIDEKKYTSSEYPCKNKIGETVNTKLWSNRIAIIEDKK